MQGANRSDLVFGAPDAGGGIAWRVIAVTCPWPWTASDGATLETSYRKKAGKHDTLRHIAQRNHGHNNGELE
jgi:hypothetical protein